jgi:hypothetical protein
MTYLVEVAYVSKSNPLSRQVTSERIEANDPDAAIGAARALYRGRVVDGKYALQIRRCRLISDFIVRVDMSIAQVFPQNDGARDWLEDHVDEEAQWLGNALVVERRYLDDLVQNLRGDGFTVGV